MLERGDDDSYQSSSLSVVSDIQKRLLNTHEVCQDDTKLTAALS